MDVYSIKELNKEIAINPIIIKNGKKIRKINRQNGNSWYINMDWILKEIMHGLMSNSKIWTLDKKLLRVIPKEYIYQENPKVV